MPIKKIVFHYEPGSRFIIYTDGLSKTPTPSAIDRSDSIEREFIEKVHLDTNDLLQELLVSRMRHSVINDDICIIAGTLFLNTIKKGRFKKETASDCRQTR
ncbi:hypothetical protein RCO48_22715 [Peribacillus frigoritolerans]|nr:hypothetical protein [Peribacillus frigoritolerans]